MQDIEITTSDIARALNRLNTSMSRFSDNIPAYFLKQVNFTLVHIMTVVCNYFFDLVFVERSYVISVIAMARFYVMNYFRLHRITSDYICMISVCT